MRRVTVMLSEPRANASAKNPYDPCFPRLSQGVRTKHRSRVGRGSPHGENSQKQVRWTDTIGILRLALVPALRDSGSLRMTLPPKAQTSLNPTPTRFLPRIIFPACGPSDNDQRNPTRALGVLRGAQVPIVTECGSCRQPTTATCHQRWRSCFFPAPSLAPSPRKLKT